MSQKNKGNVQRSQPNNPSLVAYKASYSGPLPHPETLKKFEEIVPGSANRIITQFEEQSQHRRMLETKVIHNDIFLSKMGLLAGFIIGLLAVSGGVYTALLGHEMAGGFIGSAGLIGLVSVFVYGTRMKQKHLNSREQK